MSEYRHTFGDSDWSLRPVPPQKGLWRVIGYWILYWTCIAIIVLAGIALCIGIYIVAALMALSDKTNWKRWFTRFWNT